MNENNPILGIVGTASAFGLGEINHIFGIFAGVLTCILVTLQIIKHIKNRNK